MFNTKSGTALGGSAGGDCGGNGTAAPLRGIWPFGTDGGATGNSGGAYSPGAGGGAGGPGSDRRTWGGVQLGGKGGDGVACSITGESVFYAAGGGSGIVVIRVKKFDKIGFSIIVR